MKTISFILIVLLSSCTSFKVVTAPQFNEIIEVNGTKDELFVKANEWMVRTFKDARSVIQFQDKEAGKIIGKYLLHRIKLNIKDEEIFSLITISVRDNASRIEIEPIGTWNYDPTGFTLYTYSPEMAQNDIKLLVEDYKSFLETKDNSW